MRKPYVLVCFILSALFFGLGLGYVQGKHDADRYYAYHQNTWPANWHEHSVNGMVLEGNCEIGDDKNETWSYWYRNSFIQSDKPCHIYPWKEVGEQR